MRFFIAFAIFSFLLLLSTNASPIFDENIEQKYDNQRVWMHKTQEMEGNGQQIISTNDRTSLNDNVQVRNGGSRIRQSNSGQFVSTSSNRGTSGKNFIPNNSNNIRDTTNNGRSTRLSSSSPSYSLQITNGKYIISLNNGDCIYKPGKIIENDVIRGMTDSEMQKIQRFLNDRINVPCFCAKC